MPSSKVQLTGGVFQDAEGNVLANGYLLMRLSRDGVVSGVGQVGAGVDIKITLNSSGSVDTTNAQSVWGNDQLLPANTYYRVTGYTAQGQPAWGPNNQQVNGSGGTFDVGTWVPNQVISWTPTISTIVLETNGTPNSKQGLFNITGASHISASESAGTVTIQDSGLAPLASPALTGTPTAPTPTAGDSTTQIATTAFVQTAVQANSPVLPTPLFWQRVWATDANSDTTGAATLNQDGPSTANSNLTNNFASGVYQAPGADIMLALINVNNGNENEFQGICQGDLLNSTPGARGPRWGNITVFTSRFFPKPAPSPPAGADNAYFIGLCTNQQRAGLFPGIMSLTTGQTTATWYNNIAVAGFYYHPSESPNWQILVSDGAGNASKTITTTAASTTLTQELDYTFDGTTVTFYIDKTQVGTLSTNLPPNNTGMCLTANYGNLGSVQSALNEKFGFAYMAAGFR